MKNEIKRNERIESKLSEVANIKAAANEYNQHILNALEEIARTENLINNQTVKVFKIEKEIEILTAAAENSADAKETDKIQFDIECKTREIENAKNLVKGYNQCILNAIAKIGVHEDVITKMNVEISAAMKEIEDLQASEVDVTEYAVSPDAQEVAVQAEIANAEREVAMAAEMVDDGSNDDAEEENVTTEYNFDVEEDDDDDELIDPPEESEVEEESTVGTVKRENLVKMPEIEAITAINKNYGTGVYTWYYKKFDTVKKAFRYLWNKRKNYKGTTEFIFQIEVDGKMIFNYNSVAKENGLRLMTAEIEKLYNDAEGYSDEEEEEFYYRTNRGTVRKFKIGETNFKAGLAEVSAVESVNVPEDDGSNDDDYDEDELTVGYNFDDEVDDDELIDAPIEYHIVEIPAVVELAPVTFALERFGEDNEVEKVPAKFEVGKIYHATSVLFEKNYTSILVVKRTEKFVTFVDYCEGFETDYDETMRARILTDNSKGEYVEVRDVFGGYDSFKSWHTEPPKFSKKKNCYYFEDAPYIDIADYADDEEINAEENAPAKIDTAITEVPIDEDAEIKSLESDFDAKTKELVDAHKPYCKSVDEIDKQISELETQLEALKEEREKRKDARFNNWYDNGRLKSQNSYLKAYIAANVHISADTEIILQGEYGTSTLSEGIELGATLSPPNGEIRVWTRYKGTTATLVYYKSFEEFKAAMTALQQALKRKDQKFKFPADDESAVG